MAVDLFSGAPESPTDGIRVAMPDADVVYYPAVFSPTEADALFLALRDQVEWQQEEITFYGKVHDLPRLTAWYGDAGKKYTYSGISVHSLPWIEPLAQMKQRIERISDVNFNSVLLNLYRTGQDSVSWHADDEPELGNNPVIGSISLGEERPFHMKHKHLDEKRKIILENGSYLAMRGSTQHFWVHQVPKTTRKIRERINLTFRNIV